MKPKSTSKKFEDKARPFETGDVCRIQSERNIRHKSEPLNGRYGKILELKPNASDEMSVYFELQSQSSNKRSSFRDVRDDYRFRRDYTRPPLPKSEKIWISISALKFVRSEEDEILQRRLKESREHNKPKVDRWGDPVRPQGTYNLANGKVEDQNNDAMRAALSRALKHE